MNENSRQVEKILDNYANGLEKSIATVENMLNAIEQMNDILETVADNDALKDLGVKYRASDIDKNAKELLEIIAHLQNELKVTSQKVREIRY